MFFTARALEYKWQERFSIADAAIGESFDIGTIFKARNAIELATIVQKMALWDLARSGTPVEDTVIVSLRDQFITPNPDDKNHTFSPVLVDEGLRYNPTTGAVVDKVTRFQQILGDLQATTPGGHLDIPFDTTILEGFGGSFFAGPDFSDLANPESGLYRDKIEWIAVNIIADDGVTPPSTNGRSGRLTYGGNTYFRTRVPLCPDRTVAQTATAGDGFDPQHDFSGELIVSPFRFYQDTTFNGVFELLDIQNTPSLKIAYSADSANNPTVEARLLDPTKGFLRADFKERSVAATHWILRINSGEVDLSKIQDVELVIKHLAYPRPQITCTP